LHSGSLCEIRPKPIAVFGFKKNGRYGLMDKTRKELVEPKYDGIPEDFFLHLDEGYIPVKEGEKWGFIKLNFPISPNYFPHPSKPFVPPQQHATPD
jgi:hypothetical protein